MPTPNFNRPDNLMTALQFNETTGLPELRVNLGSDSVTITGSVNVGTVVEVESTPTNPVHTHISEIGTSGILSVPYMPSGIVDASGHINDLTHPLFVELTPSGALTVNQGTTPWIVENSSTDLTIANSTYEMNVARGLVPGQTFVQRSGYNPDISQGTSESIWVEGGIYPFTQWTTAQKLYILSTNIADTGQTLYIEGLDSNYNIVTDIVITNGLTAAETTKNFLRIFTATIVSADTPSIGEITFHLGNSTGVVVAHIRSGFSITKLSQYTIPAGYTGYIQYGDATTFHGGSGNIGSLLVMMVRPINGTFFAAFQAEVVNGYYRNDFKIPMRVPEKTDIDVRVTADANNTQATCNWQLILIPN